MATMQDFTKQLEKLRDDMPTLFSQMLFAFGQGVRTETIFRANKRIPVNVNVWGETVQTLTGIAPSGKPWTPLAPLTISLRRKAKPGEPIETLKDTMSMFGSLNVKTDPANLTVNVGFADPKAKLHQFGGKSSRNGKVFDVPARPMLDLNSENKNEQATIQEGINRFLKEFDKRIGE